MNAFVGRTYHDLAQSLKHKSENLETLSPLKSVKHYNTSIFNLTIFKPLHQEYLLELNVFVGRTYFDLAQSPHHKS